MHKIGFMQGRLVDRIDGKIQAFPELEWELEFPRAAELGLDAVEWTLDDQGLERNPFVMPEGQARIRELSAQHGISIPSLTGDCFMQAPFWKAEGAQRQLLLDKLDLVLRSAATLGVRYIVVPLVDNGALQSAAQKEVLLAELRARTFWLRQHGVQVVFETDLAPAEYAAFIGELPDDTFNINYDIGNSASLGFDPDSELAAYGHRIANVHVKDRISGGTTVALGQGAAQFDKVFAGLGRLNYQGNFILQTARADDNRHAQVLASYLQMTRGWVESHLGS